MGGFFGAVSRKNCKYDVFFGTDYHSHLGTKRGGLAFYDTEKGFSRQIHNIENTPFRTKFEGDLAKMNGTAGIGAISDTDPQPLLVRSHLGMFAIASVGIINNMDQIVDETFAAPGHYFMAMSSGKVNDNELIAALINRCGNLVEGIKFAQHLIEGTCTILLLTEDGIIAARDKLGRLPIVIGKNDMGHCVSMESFACQKLGYTPCYNLGPGEIVKITTFGYEQLDAVGRIKNIWYTAIDWVRTVFWSLEMLITGKAGLAEMSGPVGIVQQMGEAADAAGSFSGALINLLYFGAFIAV